MELQKKLIRGSLWNILSQFGSQGINTLITLILARLLLPEDFGIVGMATVITSFLGYFSEFGLTPSLIYKNKVDDLDCNTVFWSTIGFSVIIYISVYLLAPKIAEFYGKPELSKITRVAFIYFLVMPLNFIPDCLEIIDLNYDKLAKSELLSSSIAGGFAIYLAFKGFGAWSIVWQQIIRVFFRSIFMNIYRKWTFKFTFSFKRFKELINYGYHFTIHNLLLYVAENMDYLLVGKMLGARALGIYTIAFKLSKYPVQKLNAVFGKMLFPAFSSIKNDKENINKYFLDISIGIPILFIPLVLFMFLTIESLILILISEKWVNAVPIVRIFFIYLIINSFCFHDEHLMKAINMVKQLNKIKILTSMVFFIFGYFAIKHFELIGIAVAYTITNIIHMIIVKTILIYKLNISLKDYKKKLININFMILAYAIVSIIFYCIWYVILRNDYILIAGEGIILTITLYLFNQKYSIVSISNRRISLKSL